MISVAVVLDRLLQVGIDVPKAIDSGRLVVVTKKDTYEKYGDFQPEQMVGDLKIELEKALLQGFSGLRATGEMTWALDNPKTLQRLVEYEAVLHTRFSPRLTGLCQYDETRFSPGVLSDIIRIHPVLFARGKYLWNKFAAPPEQVRAGTLSKVSVSSLLQ